MTNKQIATNATPVPSRVNVHRMFDGISRRYDLLNHLLSLGMDFYWRRRAVHKIDRKPNQVILDLACGTGDLALAAVKSLKGECRVIGIDKASRMLQLARAKITGKQNSSSISLALGDGMMLPVRDLSCDAAMIAFGIRNMPEAPGCLKEMNRLLNLGGKVIVLEFSSPSSGVLRFLHRLYLRNVVPMIGGLVSGDSDAYRYLDRTIETFPRGEDFCRLMKQAGFVEITAEPLSFGIVSIYTGRKI